MKKYMYQRALLGLLMLFALMHLCTVPAAAQQLQEPETKAQVPVSRMVAVEEKQRLEISYPGHGWVYIGERTSQQGLKYEQRKLQDDASVFMFTAEKKGKYILHFSYFDVFTNDFITDAVAVTVTQARSPLAKSTVKAPEYKNGAKAEKPRSSSPETPAKGLAGKGSGTVEPESAVGAPAGEALPSPEQPVDPPKPERSADLPIPAQPETTADKETESTQAEPLLSSDQLLEKAQAAIAAADGDTALAYLDRFFAVATQKLDEGWFLKGRAYELNSTARNIGSALDAYRKLTETFPQSKYWAEADTRIRYITDFYVTIR